MMENRKPGRPLKDEVYGCPTKRVLLPSHLIVKLREIAKRMLAEEAAAKKTTEAK